MKKQSDILRYTISDAISYIEPDVPFIKVPTSNVKLEEQLYEDYLKPRTCPYCKGLLIRSDLKGRQWTERTFEIYKHSYQKELLTPPTTCILTCCRMCNWWSFYEDGFYAGIDAVTTLHWGKVYEFSVGDAEAPVSALRRCLAKKPGLVYDMNPTALERLVAAVFSEYFNCEALHVGGPGDGGIDVVLVRGRTPTLVQVKRRSRPGSTESVSTVRELLGTLMVQGRHHGMVVSTASRFSHEAVREAQVPIVRNMGYTVGLYNYDALCEVLRDTSPPQDPWEDLWNTRTASSKGGPTKPSKRRGSCALVG